MFLSSLSLRRGAGAVVACAAMLSPVAHSQVTTTPVVTTWADVKQLKFDWDPVPNAAYYKLQFHAPGSTTTFFTLGPTKTAATSNIAVHLFDWDNWYYGVAACDSDDTCREGTPATPMKALMQDAIGYIKSSVPEYSANFGFRVALAEDGNTAATWSEEETTAGGSQAAPFYVFTKIAGKWRQQARIFPKADDPKKRNLGMGSMLAGSLALSADGNTLLVAMPFEGYLGVYHSVTVYRRTNNTWAREYQLVASNFTDRGSQEDREFALMNSAGTRIAFRFAINEPVRMIERGSSGWTERAVGQPLDGCRYPRLSGDGNTLAYLCGGGSPNTGPRVFLAKAPGFEPIAAFSATPDLQSGDALAINYDATRIAVTTNPPGEQSGEGSPPAPLEVHVFRTVNGAWQQFGATLRAGSWADTSGAFGETIELSKSGAYLAVLDRWDSAQGTGVWSPPLTPASGDGPRAGAVYIYEFTASGPRLRRVVKPNQQTVAGFGFADFAFANDGRTLLIGQPNESSNAAGIDGDRNNTSMPSSGALWLY